MPYMVLQYKQGEGAPPTYNTIEYIKGQGVSTHQGQITITGIQPGDLVFGLGITDGTGPAPIADGSWTNLYRGSWASSNVLGWNLSYQIATGTSVASGFWQYANISLFTVYRGCIVGSRTSTVNVDSAYQYKSTPVLANGASHIATFAGRKHISSNLITPPSGTTRRASVSNVDNFLAGMNASTPGPVTEWTEQLVSDTGTHGRFAFVVELQATEI